ncbi:unnamed protein product, partial [Prorocentrum cordatum]
EALDRALQQLREAEQRAASAEAKSKAAEAADAGLRSQVRELRKDLSRAEEAAVALRQAGSRATQRLQEAALKERELEMRLASISGMDGTGRLIRVVLCSVSLVAKVVTCSPCRGVREARYFRQEDDGFDEGMPMRSADSSSRPAPELIGASPAERPDAERQNLV